MEVGKVFSRTRSRAPFPRLEVSLQKIEHNARLLVRACKDRGISVIGVTKAFCGNELIARAMLAGGVDGLADSRIQNLRRLRTIRATKWLLRLPMISQARAVVQCSDISLNSEVETLRALSEAACSMHRRHGVILMFDLGDLREGMTDEAELLRTTETVLGLDNLILAGIGTNLTCQSGVIPSRDHLARLVALRDTLQSTFDIALNVVSGGSSSSLHLLEGGAMPPGINQLRLGEAILLGRETAYGRRIPGCHDDCFRLLSEIIEIKEKPSVPTGEIGLDSFGNRPSFVDKGIRRRAICAIGKQDVFPEAVVPEDQDITIVGASSDHLILDITESPIPYRVGEAVAFRPKYAGILSCMTSSYVSKSIH